MRTLHGRLGRAYQRIAELEGRDPQLALDQLLEDLQQAELERQRREQAELAAETQAKPKQKRERKPQTGHGPRPQSALPVVEVVAELSEEQAVCQVCGGRAEPLGDQFEESEEIHVIERQYVKRRIRRRKYRCRCNACVITAPGPLRVIPGGRYSVDFMVQVAADKWLDHIPLERQSRIQARHGLETGSQTLFDQAWGLAQRMRPIYDRLGQRVLEAPVLHADETRWPRLDAREASPWTVWTRTTPDIAHYAILPSKSRKAADTLFADYRGTIVVDGYQVYESLARDGPDLELANCWAHVRRKFAENRENFPVPCTRVLEKIRRLYDVEDEVGGPFPGDAEAQRERGRLRAEKSKPIVEEIRGWACAEVGLPRSELGKAVRYMLKRWQALTRFLDDARIPLDNNAAERSLRGPVVGRKVHYGSKSKRGTEVAAIFYTLFETAKLCGVEPVDYLRQATLRILENPEDLLLPHDLRPPGGEPNT
ncbi:MAG: IS66 family transposase [Thermoanaerobaculia bacterium]|nr:IS66 family transposase [Thermoanaerobaculia bacterium]